MGTIAASPEELVIGRTYRQAPDRQRCGRWGRRGWRRERPSSGPGPQGAVSRDGGLPPGLRGRAFALVLGGGGGGGGGCRLPGGGGGKSPTPTEDSSPSRRLGGFSSR